jgi:ribosomal protein S18 acetylase RimI-like enzyme
MRIRCLPPDEWPAYRAFRLRALETDPDAFGETVTHALGMDEAAWRGRLDRSDRAVIVAEDQTGLLGMAAGGPAEGYPGVAGLYGMWVAPEARGRGVGAALVEAVRSWAREMGYEAVGLGVTTTNASAIRLYERAGFVDTGERHPLRVGSELEIAIMTAPSEPPST